MRNKNAIDSHEWKMRMLLYDTSVKQNRYFIMRVANSFKKVKAKNKMTVLQNAQLKGEESSVS